MSIVTDHPFNRILVLQDLASDVSKQQACKPAVSWSHFDLPIKDRRIPIIPVFDDPPVDDPHEAASLDAKRFSSRCHTKGLAQEGTGHDPFARLRFLGHCAL